MTEGSRTATEERRERLDPNHRRMEAATGAKISSADSFLSGGCVLLTASSGCSELNDVRHALCVFEGLLLRSFNSCVGYSWADICEN